MTPISIYSFGIVHCSVCAPHDMTAEQVEQEVNAHEPTGISSRWHVSEETFRGGEPNPFRQECGNHWLLVC